VAILLAHAATAGAASVVYQGVAPWRAADIPAGYPSAFDVMGDGKIVALSGLSVNLLSANGAFERTIGTVPDYDNGPEYGSFCRVSPDGSRVWVGFTVNLNADDRVYRLPFAGGSATHEATLAGNYDLEFAQVSSAWTPFASAAQWTSPNSVWRLDTSGGAHTKVVQLSGYGAGFAFDGSGDLWALDQTAQKLYRFGSADVQNAALGLTGALVPDNAGFVSGMAFAGSDVTVDGAGHVFFNANDPAYAGLSQVALVQPGYAGAYKYDNIASGIAGYNWTTQIDFGGGIGDATLGEGGVYVGDYYGAGNVTRLYVPEPASVVLALTAAAGLGLARRRRPTTH
jgi:hypothetical protein